LSSIYESNQLLIELGCTALQAKVYLNLLALENTTAKTLAKKANIARAEAYRILNELQEKNLLKKL
jgi:sugar-specific transcriptional regulator TrmB